MELERHRIGAKRKIGSLMRERHPSPGAVVEVPDFEARRDRLLNFQKRLGQHTSWQAARLRRKESEARMVAQTKEALDALGNKVIMAFDVERCEGRIIEVGVTMIGDNVLSTSNLRVAGNNFLQPFLHGESIEYDTLEDLHVMLTSLSNFADYYLGHSLVNDFEALKENDIRIDKKPFFDTTHFARVNPAFPNDGSPKLVDLAAHYGIDNPNPHNGGNDSRTTALVFLALLKDAQ